MGRRKFNDYRVAVFDLETSPFNAGVMVWPFTVGILIEAKNGEPEIYRDFWGDDCLRQLSDFLATIKDPLHIYAHNGGSFDTAYVMVDGLLNHERHLRLINGRIAETYWHHHRVRDSYLMVPVSLKQILLKGGKGEIDYEKHLPQNREANKNEILNYQKQDCIVTLAAVQDFRDRFGDVMTSSGAALKELQRMCPFEKCTDVYDEIIRPYYFGGRCEPFRTGVIKGEITCVDFTSMYPFCMRTYEHFCGPDVDLYSAAEAAAMLDTHGRCAFNGNPNNPYFIEFTGISNNCAPLYDAKDKRLNFPSGEGRYRIGHHELQAGLRHGLIKVDEIHQLIVSHTSWNGAGFVDKYFAIKSTAKDEGDIAAAKLILNSSYGKTGQNPMRWTENKVVPAEEVQRMYAYGWLPCAELLGGFDVILEKPLNEERAAHAIQDVGIAASITSAARAHLLDTLVKIGSDNLIYCDTDSAIFRGEVDGLPIDPKKLGGLKIEWTAPEVYIGGRKLYAAHATKPDGTPIEKVSSKGANLTVEAVRDVARGMTVEFQREAPQTSIKSFGIPGRKLRIKMLPYLDGRNSATYFQRV